MIFASCFQYVFKKIQVAVKEEETAYENRLCDK